jgi:hypothetical protein
MFCPQCKAEYRQGFTRCADCDVALVSQLPAAPGHTDDDPFCAFWQGDDTRLHAELASVLDDAGILHKTVRRKDHLFNLSNYPAFQLGVPFSLFEKAEAAVRDAFQLEASHPDAVQSLNAPVLLPQSSERIRKLPPALAPGEDENIPGPPTDGGITSLELEETTVEVWSGVDSSVGDMLVASLHENQIHTRRQTVEEIQSVRVKFEDQARAREIIREIVEGIPPE